MCGVKKEKQEQKMCYRKLIHLFVLWQFMTFLLVKTEKYWSTALALLCHTYGTSLRQVNCTIVCNHVSFFVTIGTFKLVMCQLLKMKTHVQHNKTKTSIWKSTFNSHKSVTIIHMNLYSANCWGWSRQGAKKHNSHHCRTHFHFKKNM